MAPPGRHVLRGPVSISEERLEWQTEWRRESHQLWGRQDGDSRGCEG